MTGRVSRIFSVPRFLATACFALAGWSSSNHSLADLVDRSVARISDRTWVVVLAVFAAVASLVVGWGLLDSAFLTDDEMAMLFQAELLRSGRLWAEPTPFPDVFHYAMMIESPRWYGIYPVGHPAVLALSLLTTGDPRPLIALVAAGWVVATWGIARKVFDRETALMATALLCFSPFFILSTGSLAAELTSGLFLLAALNAALRLGGTKDGWLSVALGVCLGAAYVARPYTALAFGLPLGIWVAWRWYRRELWGAVPLIAFASAVPFVVLYLWVNFELTGSPWLTPYEINFPGRFRLGFGQDAFGIIHTPELALAVAGLSLFELNAWTLGWPLSFLPIGAAFALERPRGSRLVLAALPLVILLAYVPVPMAGVHDTGPIYYLEILPLLVIFAARGLVLSGRRVAGMLEGRGRDLLAWAVVAATVVGVLGFWSQQVDVLADLRRFNQAPYDLAERTIEGRALVFVDEIQTSQPSSWVLGLRPPRPNLSDRIVYCHGVSLRRAADVLRWTEDRRGWFLSRDRLTGDVSLIPLPSAGEQNSPYRVIPTD